MPRTLPKDTYDLEPIMTARFGGLDRSGDLYRCVKATLRHCRTTRSALSYAADVQQFLAWADRQTLDPFAMNRDDLEDWRESYTSNTAKTRQHKVTVIRAFYLEAEERRLVATNPARKLSEGRHSDTSSPPALSLEQAKLLVASVRAECVVPGRICVAKRDLCIVMFGLKLGLRADEIRRLQYGDLDLNSPIPSVVVLGKERSQVRMKLPTDVADAVADLRSELERFGVKIIDHDPIAVAFPNTGMPNASWRRPNEPLPGLTQQGLYNVVRDRLAAIGVTGPKVGPHRLRKTSATLAWLNSRDLFLVQKLMRHADPSTTVNHYVKPAEELALSGSDYIDLG